MFLKISSKSRLSSYLLFIRLAVISEALNYDTFLTLSSNFLLFLFFKISKKSNHAQSRLPKPHLANFFSEAFDYCTNFWFSSIFFGATPAFPTDWQIGDVGHNGYGGQPIITGSNLRAISCFTVGIIEECKKYQLLVAAACAQEKPVGLFV